MHYGCMRNDTELKSAVELQITSLYSMYLYADSWLFFADFYNNLGNHTILVTDIRKLVS